MDNALTPNSRHFRLYLRTISDVDDPVEDVVGGGRVGDLRDAESAERAMQ